MMAILRTTLVCGISILALASCGWFSDDRGFIVNSADDYLVAKEQPPVEIPPDVNAAPFEDVLVIPEIPEQPRVRYFTKGAPRPDTIYAREDLESVKIQKLGERRWLVIGQPPATVWPKLKQFLGENGVRVGWENPQAGRLNTEWLLLDKSEYRDVVRLVIRDAKANAKVTTGRDRLLFLVEQGIRPRTSEIHIRHQNDSLAQHEDATWVEASDLPELEAEMLNEVGAYMASNLAEEEISFVAQNISTQTKADLDKDQDGRPILRLNLDFNRAWATVGQALENAKVEVEDIDRTAGVFFVNVSDSVLTQEAEPGFLKRLFGKGQKDRQKLQVKVLPHEPADGAQYDVSVYMSDGAPAPSELGQEMLVLIREFAT